MTTKSKPVPRISNSRSASTCADHLGEACSQSTCFSPWSPSPTATSSHTKRKNVFNSIEAGEASIQCRLEVLSCLTKPVRIRFEPAGRDKATHQARLELRNRTKMREDAQLNVETLSVASVSCDRSPRDIQSHGCAGAPSGRRRSLVCGLRPSKSGHSGEHEDNETISCSKKQR